MDAALLRDDLFSPGGITEARISDHFASEPLLLLRVATFCSEVGRPPIAPVTVAARHFADRLESVDGANARAQIEAMLLTERPNVGLQWLHDAALLPRVLPELEATVDFVQEAGRKHKDVWEHTKQVVCQSPPRSDVRWAALLHDVGKVPTRTFLPDGRVHFHRHAEVGARMFDGIARRLVFEREARRHIRFLVYHHLRANQYEGGWTDSAVRRFDRELGTELEDLLDLSRADITTKRDERRKEAWRNLDELRQRIAGLREEDARLPALPKGIGDVLMARYALGPGRWIADLKGKLEEAIEAGEIEPRREADYYVSWLDRTGVRPS